MSYRVLTSSPTEYLPLTLALLGVAAGKEVADSTLPQGESSYKAWCTFLKAIRASATRNGINGMRLPRDFLAFSACMLAYTWVPVFNGFLFAVCSSHRFSLSWHCTILYRSPSLQLLGGFHPTARYEFSVVAIGGTGQRTCCRFAVCFTRRNYGTGTHAE